jgi:hypothetical protein
MLGPIRLLQKSKYETFLKTGFMLTLSTKSSQELTHFIDAPLPEPNSTIVLYYYSKDFPSVSYSTRNFRDLKTIKKDL